MSGGPNAAQVPPAAVVRWTVEEEEVMPEPRSAPVTVPSVRRAKRRDGHPPLVMVTAYDAPSARIADAAGVDLILVGDSVANNVLGFEDTLHVTVADMAHHTAAVARARPSPLVVADLPWMSYHLEATETVRNAAMLIRAGAQAVKLEGGAVRVQMVEALVAAEIPVMGHLGLTPQSVNAMGGYRVQARTDDSASALAVDAKALAAAGCFALVLEGVPERVGRMLTESLEVPTIGIGAGPDCDGQVLVFHDILGLNKSTPKFVRRYAELADAATAAVSAFAADVRSGAFPADAEVYH
jgi:3-methyl-2-oxobutanoate hydroxymethyltransferase